MGRFQHTAARRRLNVGYYTYGGYEIVSTHSRPKAAVIAVKRYDGKCKVSTHSRPKAAEILSFRVWFRYVFQHTAARRRLRHKGQFSDGLESFNTQPPEGGWVNGRRFGH